MNPTDHVSAMQRINSWNPFEIGKQAGRKSSIKSQFTQIEQGIHQSAKKMSGPIRLAERAGRMMVGLSDDCPHFQTTAGQKQRGDLSVMIPSAIVVFSWCPSHFSRNDQQDPVAQSALMQIFQKC